MPKIWRVLFVAVVFATSLAALPAHATSLRLDVHGLEGKRCTAYFHFTGKTMPWPLMLSLRGTGVYTTAALDRLDPAERSLIEEGLVTIVTLDKPGIAVEGEPAGKVLVDDLQYNAYVQDDLVQCSVEALTWALREHGAHAGAQEYVLLSGHSEGAQVTLRLLNRLAGARDMLAGRVRGLFLSGLPMVDWRRMLSAQLAPDERQTFFTAFQRRDNQTLRSFGNLSFDYLTSVFAQEPLGATLEQLAERGSDARFFIYQGLYDRHTPPGPVMDFVAYNRARRVHHQHALTLRSRYYPAGHGLNGQALGDIRRDVESFIRGTATDTAASVN